MVLRSLFLLACVAIIRGQIDDISARTVVIRLEPQPVAPNFMKPVEAPHAIPQTPASVPPASAPVPLPVATQAPIQGPIRTPIQVPSAISQSQFPGALPPGVPPTGARQPTFTGVNGQQFVPTVVDQATPPPPPPVNIPPDVQNQLIKFFGLDSFGIPGLTGNHPNGFAGAIQELRAAGIPVQGLPAEHIGAQVVKAPQSGNFY